jgi:hypothetical protein
MGFSMLGPNSGNSELPRPQTVNWDRLDAQRAAYLPQRARLQRYA